ncbi:MAG: hypothetical protein JWM89_1037 [Acidimicrobiales bacterium]|nr:hypothetical protein [Acidimicrobiales bacterium]
MPELDLSRIQALVEEAIDQGASTVGEIHQAVAAAPLKALGQIEPLSGAAEAARDLTEQSIGSVYDTIRRVNEQVGIFAEQLLSKKDDLAD